MAYIAYKFVRTGNGFKERLHVKAFKTMNDLGAFLCKQNDNSWKEGGNPSYQVFPQKTGIYAYAGGQWHNVKRLDPSVLVHV